MKKCILSAMLAVILCFSFSACANTDLNPDTRPPDDQEQPLPPNDNETPALPNPSDPDQEETPGVPDQPGNTETPPTAPETPDDEPEIPTEPETPAVRYDTLIASTVNGLQVRKGAGTSYAAIGSLDRDDMAEKVSQQNGWVEIRYYGGTAYVSATYCRDVSFTESDALVEAVIDVGETLLGLPYVYGAQRYHWGNGVKNTDFDGKSYDCSSLTQYMYKIGANINLATTSREQSLQGNSVAKSELKRGDLMFFTNASRVHLTGLERIGHVGVYFGENMILHTASDHAVIEPISAQRWDYFINARRFL